MSVRAAFRLFVGSLFAAAVAFVSPGPSFAQAVLAARVNGVGIPLDLLDRQFEELLRERKLQIARMNNPGKAKEIKREALDNLVRTELLWQEAKTAGLVVTDEEVSRAIADVRARFRNDEAFARRVELSGFTEAGYREHTRKVLSADRFAETIVQRDVQITDADIEKFYEYNPRFFRREEQLKARQILIGVPQGATAEQREQARGRARDLQKRARAGESFDALARSHSDHATRQWGGELDPFSRGTMAKPFEDAAFALKRGQISDVVETSAGFHVIQLEERVPAASVPLKDARQRITEYLRGSRGKEAVDREVEALRALGNVEILTPL